MSQDQVRELLDLAAVHCFHLSVLEQVTGETVPTPRDPAAGADPATVVARSVSVQRRWINILDLAITPAIFRDALRDFPSHQTAEALLRYYIVKKPHGETDRDKADFLSTFLFRNPPPWRKREALPAPSDDYQVQFVNMQALDYEGELYSILGEIQPPQLAEEHYQLAKEFEHFHFEVDEFRHFDQIVDSGITARVRELKQRFGDSFYHPRILSTVAVYNAFFGRRFDELFRKATDEIRAFAKKVQTDGGSIMSRVDGDVLVKDLAAVEDTQILNADYGHARESFRRVSCFKKAVDSRRSGRVPATLASAAPAAPKVSDAVVTFSRVQPLADVSAPGVQVFEKNEHHKITALQDTIFNFVRVADAGAASVVPLRNGNVVLSASEVDAFRNGYNEEKSFRADFARQLRLLATIQARLIIELANYSKARGSEYLWKPHADSMKFLLTFCDKAIPEAEALAETAGKRGLSDKVKAMAGSIVKLRQQMKLCAHALQA